MNKLLGLALLAVAARAGLVDDTNALLAKREFTTADKLIGSYKQARGVDAELALAESFVARGYLSAGDLKQADAHATRAQEWALSALGPRKLDLMPQIPLAISAVIEVRSQVMAKNGDRAAAVKYLDSEQARWRNTSIEPRIQKNLNLLTLVGKPAPAMNAIALLGGGELKMTEFAGRPVLLFFWAHWCPDCKADAPVIAKALEQFKDLRLIAPTGFYGFVGSGDEADTQAETRWIDAIWRRYYSALGSAPVPLSSELMGRYGVSTTPTIVLLDRNHVVRMYHPGAMTYAELAPHIARLVAAAPHVAQSQH